MPLLSRGGTPPPPPGQADRSRSHVCASLRLSSHTTDPQRRGAVLFRPGEKPEGDFMGKLRLAKMACFVVYSRRAISLRIRTMFFLTFALFPALAAAQTYTYSTL